jgi:hypothetical protein
VTISSAEEFVRLRTSSDPEDYRRSASEPASLEVWSAVIADYPEMRFWVAQNKTVPLVVLQRLAGDVDPRVREMVARKRRADQPLLARLAEDPDVGVRLAVARNPKTPEAVLARLHTDDVPEVSAEAMRRLAAHGDSAAGN